MRSKKRNLLQGVVDGLEMVDGAIRAHWGDPDAWERAIRTFEARDREHMPAAGSVVFVGSSSFNFWHTMEEDMAPLPVINRGFGGARMRDVVRYLDRIVLPYRPRAVVLFAGANDITENKPGTARRIYDGYREFVERVQSALPDTIIYFVAITPVPARWKYWPIAVEANRLVEQYTRTHRDVRFIDFTSELLRKGGTPDRSLYRLDRIHPNQKGYAVWLQGIKARLEEDLTD